MNKSPTLKQKRLSKAASKPLKVAISFNKKNEKNSPGKSGCVSEGMIRVPVGSKFVPPKHSSTPKPKQNPTAKQDSSSDKLDIRLSKFQLKDCVVLVERLRKEDLPIKLSAEKAVGNFHKNQKHQLKKTSKLPPLDTFTMVSQNLPVRNVRKEHDSENTFVTTIPSEALKSFGLFTCQPELRSSGSIGSSPQVNTSLLIETPPRTSTACSSVGGHSSSHTESIDGVTGEDAEFTTAISRLVEASAPILFQSNNIEDVAQLNASNSSQPDPLEMGPQDIMRSKKQFLPVDVHCDYLYGLNQRMNCKPDILNLHELDFSNPDVRLVAPYALRPDLSQDGYFLYAAAVSRKCDKFCCLIFGVLNQYLIAYSGHFIVDKDHLYDPIKKVAVNEVKMSDFNLCRQHLVLFNVPNKMLLEMEGYFLQSDHPSYCETQLASFETLMFSINQVQLKEKVRGDIALEQMKAQMKTLPEFKDVDFSQSCVVSINQESHRVISFVSNPRTEHVFFETSLPIDSDNIGRILHKVKNVSSVKTHFFNLGSLQLKCATEAEFFTMFYAAYEEPGCTAFYRNVFLLGFVEEHFIVGVVVDKNFFIMATRRLYSRNCLPYPGMQPVKFCPKILEMIDLPLWLPYEHALTMLETRQILRHSREYAFDYQRIVESLGILDIEYPSLSLFNDSELRSRKKHNAWLEKMLNVYFSLTFRNSLNEFPVHPSNSKNPLLFSESVLRLWIHQLLRIIHELKDSSLDGFINHADISQMDFFTLKIKTFIANFLPLFGLSSESKFQCQLLGPDGIPSAVCSESLSAHEIGIHVHDHHILPLCWTEKSHKNFNFCPFSLVYQSQNPPLSEKCDIGRLRWARSLVDRWSGDSYLEVLDTLKSVNEAQLDNGVPLTENVRPKNTNVKSRNLHKKRSLASEECISSSPKRGRISSVADISD